MCVFKREARGSGSKYERISIERQMKRERDLEIDKYR